MIYSVNGGARSAVWRQILSDILNIPVAYVKDNLGAPVGNVVLAGVDIGHFRDETVVKDLFALLL
jgi:xylulokinase